MAPTGERERNGLAAVHLTTSIVPSKCSTTAVQLSIQSPQLT